MSQISIKALHYKEYCAGIERRTGINCFWVVNNSMEVLNSLHTIRRASAIESFDFSTLYTKIPHDQLKNAHVSFNQ